MRTNCDLWCWIFKDSPGRRLLNRNRCICGVACEHLPGLSHPHSNRISATVGAFGSLVLAFAMAPSFSFLNQ